MQPMDGYVEKKISDFPIVLRIPLLLKEKKTTLSRKDDVSDRFIVGAGPTTRGSLLSRRIAMTLRSLKGQMLKLFEKTFVSSNSSGQR